MRSLIYGIGEATPVDDDHVPCMARFTRYLERQDAACPGSTVIPGPHGKRLGYVARSAAPR